MADVIFRRGTTEYLSGVGIRDGQILFDTTNKHIYMDDIDTRVVYGGGDLSRSDIDSAMSSTSENPVQNKVITTKLNDYTLTNSFVTTYANAKSQTNKKTPVGCGVIQDMSKKLDGIHIATVNPRTIPSAQYVAGGLPRNGLTTYTVNLSGYNYSAPPIAIITPICTTMNDRTFDVTIFSITTSTLTFGITNRSNSSVNVGAKVVLIGQ